MAKKEAPTVATLSAPERKAVQGIKGQLVAYIKSFSTMKEKGATLAARIIPLFKRIDAEHNIGLAGFARLFDPSVPEKADDYRKHKAYYTLDYLRRVHQGAIRAEQGTAGRRPVDLATDRFTRLVQTIMQVIRPDAQAILFDALDREFGVKGRARTTLENRLKEAEPVLDLKGLIGRPVAVDASRIIHMEPRTPSTAPAPATVDVEATARRTITARRKRAA